ncbi:MAG: winged helix-turn-helix transcriptional regulator [Bacteroidetes bacterium]|nr:winged helix-turn-helix transcriptional regulator [Bacteroidota bacterium]
MNFYEELGYLVLGSRMRRLSEAFLSEINKTYQSVGIPFDASWFPVFYLLSKNERLSIKELSDATGVSHPAASQLVSNLKNKKLIKTTTSSQDGRLQHVQLTKAGHALLEKILPVWDAVCEAMEDIAANDAKCSHLLPALTALEASFRSAGLSGRISEKLAEKIGHEQGI